MEVTISQFRQNLFEMVNQAAEGQELWVTHRGRRFRIVPEDAPVSRLSRLTPLTIINEAVPDPTQSLQEEMEREWAEDWATL